MDNLTGSVNGPTSKPIPMGFLLDAHCHYQDPRLRSVDLGRLPLFGIRQAVVNGSSEEDWQDVANLAATHPDLVRPAFGLHPWYTKERTPDWDKTLESLLDAHPRASVGEIGLDRWMPAFDLPGQETVFLHQLQVAVDRDLPVSIHCLKAWGRLLELLKSNPRPSRGFLLHSYGGSWDLARSLLDLGAFFSFAGYFLRPRKTAVRDVFRRLPLDRILLETDAPDQCLPVELDHYRLPDPNDPARTINHPANLGAVYRELANLRGIPERDLQMAVWKNFVRLFGEIG